MLEEMLMQFGLKDGVFAGLFIWLLLRQMKHSEMREEKLYNFLEDMKREFAKLVGSYERLANDVAEIRDDIAKMKDDK
jgi:BhlA holin family